ncbi:MAG: hypothetical protein LUD79_04215 [Oscillospiraceae bacterium]|nr:hypothetical protein [Oscillospiraceae bacterium]
MKRILTLMALLLASLVLASCGNMSNSDLEEGGKSLATFSYAEDVLLYQDEDGDDGVNPYSFQNVDTAPIDDQTSAVERAANECTISYNATSEYYDSDADMWRIDFFTLEQSEQGTLAAVGNRQSVYMSGDGITQLVVYSE